MILFIYSKDGKVKAHSEIIGSMHHDLTKDGYKHTATINAAIFVEYLCNECEDLAREVKFLIQGEYLK